MVFNEEQKLNAIGMKILYGISTLPIIVIVFFKENSEGKAGFDDWLFLVGFTLFIMAIYFFVFESKAFTTIDRNGISYKYRPFIWNFKTIAWRDIQSVKVVSINPISDFGGWGYRFIGGRKGKALVLGGKQGLVISKKDGKRFTITTQRKQELERVLKYWKKENK